MNFYSEGGTAIQGKKSEPVPPCADQNLIVGAVQLGGWSPALADHFLACRMTYDEVLTALLGASQRIQ